MAKTLKLVIEADAKTGDIQVLNEELEKLDRTAKNAGKGIDSFVSKFKGIATGVVSIYSFKEALESVLTSGLEFNRMMEEQTNGIRALIVATSENYNSLGRQLTIQQKYTLAAKEAAKVMAELNRINAMTPHTLDQTAQIYKALYTNAKRYGATQKQMIEMTKLISIAAGNAGIAFDQLLASVDGLVNGTFEANSEMGRFLSSLGLAPAKLRELAKEGKSVEEVLKTLKDFDFDAGTMGQSLSNLTNAWNQFAGSITQSIFEDIKPALNSLADWLNDLTDAWNDHQLEGKSIFQIGEKNGLIRKAELLQEELDKIREDIKDHGLFDDLFGDSEQVLEQKARRIEVQLKQIGDRLADWGQESGRKAGELVASTFNEELLKGLKISTFAEVDKVMAEMAKRFENVTKGMKPDGKAYQKAMQVYNKEMERLTKRATELWKKEEEKKARASEEAARKAAAAYKKMLSEVDTLNKKITDDWMKAFSDKTEFQLYGLEKAYAEKYQKIEKLEQEAAKFHKDYIIKQLEADKKLLDETFEKQRIEVIQKSQMAEMKLWEDYFKLIGDKEMAIEMEKAIKRNEIVEKYGKILTEKQLQKALEASDKMIEAQRKAANEVAKIWEETYKKIGDTVNKAFKDVLVYGKSLGKTMHDLFGKIFQDLGNGIYDALMKGQDPLDAFKNGFDGLIKSFDKFAASADKLINAFGKIAGIDINGALTSSLGITGGQMMAAIEANLESGKLIDKILGYKTKASNPAWSLAIGSIPASAIGSWQKDNGGVVFENGIPTAEYTHYKKKVLWGAINRGKTKYSELSKDVSEYFDSIFSELDRMGAILHKELTLNLPKKVSFKNLEETVAKAILQNFSNVFQGSFGHTIGVELNKEFANINVDKMYNSFKDFAKKIGTTVTDAIFKSFEFEADIMPKLEANLKKTFGDFGKKISHSIEVAFQNGGLLTIPEFDKKFSDMILKQISGFNERLALALQDPVYAKIFSPEDIEGMFAGMKNAWQQWAAKQGTTVVEAINAGLQTVSLDKEQFSGFVNDFFGRTLQGLRENFETSMQNLKDAMEKIGDFNINLENFAAKRDEALKAFNFTPENIQNWHEAQVALENAATATKNFVDALKGMVGQYDEIIGQFDEFINKLRGIEIEKETKVEQTLGQVLDTLAKLEQSKDTNEILDLSKQMLTEIKALSDSFDQKLQKIADGKEEANQKFMQEIENTLKLGLSETMKDISDTVKKLQEAQEKGLDTKALEESLKSLQEERAQMTEALNKLSTEGLTKGIATEIQGALDKAIAQIAERGQDKAITEQQALINELQAQTAILQSIEGTLQKNDGQKILQDALANLETVLKNDETKQAIEEIPNKLETVLQPVTEMTTEIPQAIEQSLQPVTEMTAQIPQQLQEAIQPIGEAMQQTTQGIEQIPQSIQESIQPLQDTIGQIPETFQNALQPLGDAMAELPNTFQNVLNPLSEAVAQIPETFQNALAPVSEAIGQLPESFNNALDPVVESFGTLPEVFQNAINPIAEAMAQLPEQFNSALQPMIDSIAQLPESFQSALNPMIESMAQVSESVKQIAPELRAGIAEAMQPVQAAVNQLGGTIGQLVAAENATTAAVYAAGGQIAGAVGGLVGMLEDVRAQAAAATQAAQAAAATSEAAVQAAQAAQNVAAQADARTAQVGDAIDKLSMATYAGANG